MDTMKIKMLDTVEDTNTVPVKGDDGKWTLVPVTHKLVRGQVYDHPADFAAPLIAKGFAEAV